MRSTLVAFAAALVIGSARAADHVTLGLDWLAEAEYGGYYEAQATGLYKARGLDVEIRQGGPQTNQAQLLLAGRLDAAVASNSALALNYVQQDLPLVTVAAFFQRDPAILLAHSGAGIRGPADLAGHPIMIGADTRIGWWPFLREKFHLSDAQIRPYAGSLAPFLADHTAVQQGYLGSEPFLVHQATGETPVVLPIADAGFAGYGNLVAVRRDWAAAHADVLRRFLAATAAGWRAYLEGDPAAGNAAVRAANPGMTAALLAYGRDSLRTHRIVEDGAPVGGMTAARWQAAFGQLRQAGLVPDSLDWHRAFTPDYLPTP